ncbi:hypothetical protein BDV23DRAFT_86692 [Aspergillus alliaceus]|uniref:Uncharacterized protein n=1 Tax=Petromyces alliaceus TaxID=209559 RepID=A0A5N7C900_PETAA|nr:hypothetical protein BDV23DRAFT_86692 [Aspergillus alliaceus]
MYSGSGPISLLPLAAFFTTIIRGHGLQSVLRIRDSSMSGLASKTDLFDRATCHWRTMTNENCASPPRWHRPGTHTPLMPHPGSGLCTLRTVCRGALEAVSISATGG